MFTSNFPLFKVNAATLLIGLGNYTEMCFMAGSCVAGSKPAAPITLRKMQMAYIGLGANLPSASGPPEATLAAAVARLVSLGHVTARSRLYSTEPVGFSDQPRFINAVVALETAMPPRDLLHGLLAIEREFGRDRTAGIPNGPRTLDLDILLYGDLQISEAGLEIPHPRLAERGFVLVPLNGIAPAFRDPRTGLSVAQLMEKLFPNSQGAIDEIFKVESDDWCAGPCAGGADGT